MTNVTDEENTDHATEVHIAFLEWAESRDRPCFAAEWHAGAEWACFEKNKQIADLNEQCNQLAKLYADANLERTELREKLAQAEADNCELLNTLEVIIEDGEFHCGWCSSHEAKAKEVLAKAHPGSVLLERVKNAKEIIEAMDCDCGGELVGVFICYRCKALEALEGKLSESRKGHIILDNENFDRVADLIQSDSESSEAVKQAKEKLSKLEDI